MRTIEDWAAARSVADEAHFDDFVKLIGSERIDSNLKSVYFENADYIFRSQKVLIELKRIETEFGEAATFQENLVRIGVEAAQRFGLGAFLRSEPGPAVFYATKQLELYRSL